MQPGTVKTHSRPQTYSCVQSKLHFGIFAVPGDPFTDTRSKLTDSW